MRINIRNKNEVFNLIFKHYSINKKQLAFKLGVSFWTLRNWLKNRTVPEDKFIQLTKEYPIINKIVKYDILPDNWGSSLGGKNSFKKKSKNDIMRQIKIMNSSRTEFKIPEIKIDEKLSELVGIMMGDGCITKFFAKYDKRYRYVITVSGHSITDNEYHRNIVAKLFSEIFEIKEPKIVKIKNENAIKITVGHKPIAEYLISLGLPLGKKYDKLEIPKYFLDKELLLNRIIRGLFDTDGYFYARKDEGYRYPHVMITTKSDKLRNQLKKIFENRGYPTYSYKYNISIRGIENINKWFLEIGSSHPLTISRFNEWKRTGKLMPVWACRSIGRS